MEPEGSLPCSQEPTIGPYPDADESSLCLSTLFIYNPLTSINQVIPKNPKPCVTFRKSWFLAARSCQPLAKPPSWRATPCRLSATVYSIYSQVPSICGGPFLHPQLEDALCRGDREPEGLEGEIILYNATPRLSGLWREAQGIFRSSRNSFTLLTWRV